MLQLCLWLPWEPWVLSSGDYLYYIINEWWLKSLLFLFNCIFKLVGSAVLAHFLLNEKLRKMGILGCVLCIVGSTVIVLHAPAEHGISSVEEIWDLATQPGELWDLITHFLILVDNRKISYCLILWASWSSFSFVYSISNSCRTGIGVVLWTMLWAD